MIISPLAPAISHFKHLFFLVMQWPGMFMLKQSDPACGAGIGGDGIQVWEAWGTSSLTMGFSDILKNINILDILNKPIIQGTELLKTCMSTFSGLLSEGY